MANRHMPHASGVLTTDRAPGLRTEARAVSDAGLPTVARGPECVRERRLERETGIEPATNSLEGCDSTTELLPPIPRASFPKPDSRTTIPTRFGVDVRLRASADNLRLLDGSLTLSWPADRSPLDATRAKVGGEGRTRTFEATRATDLQSAAFDRFATSPAVCVGMRASWSYPCGPRGLRDFSSRLCVAMELAKGFEPPTG